MTRGSRIRVLSPSLTTPQVPGPQPQHLKHDAAIRDNVFVEPGSPAGYSTRAKVPAPALIEERHYRSARCVPRFCSWCNRPFCRNRSERRLRRQSPAYSVRHLYSPLARTSWARTGNRPFSSGFTPPPRSTVAIFQRAYKFADAERLVRERSFAP